MSIIDITFFYNIQKKVKLSDIDKELVEKVKNKIDNCNCFKNLKTNNNYYKKKKSYITRKDIVKKTDDKILLSNLNKITESNYNTLSNKIITNITEDNWKIVIDKLIEISFKQSNYVLLYINLYKQIIINSTRKKYLDNKIADILDSKNDELILLKINDNINILEYDDFCQSNKNKKKFKGIINIIINLIKNELIFINFNDLMRKLMIYKNYENEIFLETLHIIHNTINLYKFYIDDLKDYLAIGDFKGKMMIKFKIQDIIDNKRLKEF